MRVLKCGFPTAWPKGFFRGPQIYIDERGTVSTMFYVGKRAFLSIPYTPWDCHICRSIGPPGTTPTDRQAYGSPMGRVWEFWGPNKVYVTCERIRGSMLASPLNAGGRKAVGETHVDMTRPAEPTWTR